MHALVYQYYSMNILFPCKPSAVLNLQPNLWFYLNVNLKQDKMPIDLLGPLTT